VETEKPKVPEKVEESVFVNTVSFASLLRGAINSKFQGSGGTVFDKQSFLLEFVIGMMQKLAEHNSVDLSKIPLTTDDKMNLTLLGIASTQTLKPEPVSAFVDIALPDTSFNASFFKQRMSSITL